MDVRAIIAGSIAVIALVGLIVLAAIGQGTEALDRLDAIVTGALGLLFGLYSSPFADADADAIDADG